MLRVGCSVRKSGLITVKPKDYGFDGRTTSYYILTIRQRHRDGQDGTGLLVAVVVGIHGSDDSKRCEVRKSENAR